jgi:hypothetical protein
LPENKEYSVWRDIGRKIFVISISIAIAATITKISFLFYLWIFGFQVVIHSADLPDSIGIIIGTVISIFVGFFVFMKTYRYLIKETLFLKWKS